MGENFHKRSENVRPDYYNNNMHLVYSIKITFPDFVSSLSIPGQKTFITRPPARKGK